MVIHLFSIQILSSVLVDVFWLHGYRFEGFELSIVYVQIKLLTDSIPFILDAIRPSDVLEVEVLNNIALALCISF